MRQPRHPAVEDLVLVNVLHALSDPLRLQIVARVAEGSIEKCCELDPKVARSTMSHHLRVLREAGVIWVRAEGTMHRLCLRRDDLQARFPGLLTSILENIEGWELDRKGRSPLI